MRLVCLLALQAYCKVEGPVNGMGHSFSARNGVARSPLTRLMAFSPPMFPSFDQEPRTGNNGTLAMVSEQLPDVLTPNESEAIMINK